MSVTTFAAAQLLRALPRVRLSRAVGRLCDRPLSPGVSRVIARAYARAYRVDLSEAERADDGYASFDAFFTRRLRSGARTIERAGVVSPADGRLEATGPIDAGARLFVKGKPYDVGDLVGDERQAARYVGGSFAVVYLSPRDYHRVHSPVDGDIVAVNSLEGDLFPVNAIGERHVPRLFVENHRVAIEIQTQTLGRVTAIMVGAIIVGRISVTVLGPGRPAAGRRELEPPVAVARGDEIGIFHIGSTVVLLTEAPARISREAGPIKYGEALVTSS